MRAYAGMALPLILAGLHGSASGKTTSGEITCHRGANATMTNFDYLVLASMADSHRPISLAAYHPSEVTVEFGEH
jgi:hypothetical protein